MGSKTNKSRKGELIMTTKDTIKRARKAKEYISQLREVFTSLSRGEQAFVTEREKVIAIYEDAAIISTTDLCYLRELCRERLGE